MRDTDFGSVSTLLGVPEPDSTTEIGPTGLWSIYQHSTPGSGLNLTIQRLLDRMTDSKDAWEAINERCVLNLMCRVRLQRSGDIDLIVAPLLAELGWRNITLSIEMNYAETGC